ncbi:MAG: arginine--tRNA ligase [Treponema sp.]|jgi:arginyl-tRNA synthetase|nr:arginine--tRNA ligase [Treponema sp.]
MYDYKEDLKRKIAGILSKLCDGQVVPAQEVSPASVAAEIPPNPDMGDLGFPMFAFAKLLKKAPSQIAQMVAAELPGSSAVGPYVNVRLNRGEVAYRILNELLADGKSISSSICRPGTLSGKKIMVEFSSPNTNKPLHLGHLRNDVLGESISRILSACGAEVLRVCIINDRGIHICKSMLAYMEHGDGKTPESEGIKSDHFVGDWYVRFSKEAEADASVLLRAQELLRNWEAGESKTVALWKKMNAWAIDGWKETYKRTGVSFDQYYFESDTWQLGKGEVLKGLEKGIFYREADGAVAVDLSEEKLDKKILLRSDGTSIYITQDFGTAINRHKDWPFDKLVYVVGSEQQYHFKVLFILLEKLGYQWARNLYHLSYGMVNLPDGKMKSREGTVVDADDLIDSLKEMAVQEIRGKEREEAVGDIEGASEKIAIGALHYYLLHVSPSKDMLFDPEESLSFNGNTGPYLQYMGARISSLLRKAALRSKAGERDVHTENPRFELLTTDAEWELIKTLGAYNDAVASAAADMDSSVLASYLYELAKGFSRFYHDCPILNAEDTELAAARLALCRVVLLVLKDALVLVCIPFLEVM